jgi:hypothetical protein
MSALPDLNVLATVMPVPHGLHAGHFAGWFWTVWASVLAVALLPWVIRRARRHDPIPLLMYLGGLIVCIPEAMADHIYYLWWPKDLPGPAYNAYNLHVPLLIPLAYIGFVAMTGYFGYRLMARGLTRKGMVQLWLFFGALDLLLEYPGLTTGAYKYYGPQPFFLFDFPFWMSWINATGMLLGSFLLWFAAPRLKGWHRAVVALIPSAGYVTAWYTLAWPNAYALDWNPGVVGRSVLSLCSLGACLITLRVIVGIVCKPQPTAARQPEPAAPEREELLV